MDASPSMNQERLLAVAIKECFGRDGKQVIRLDDHKQFSTSFNDIMDAGILCGYIRRTKKGKLELTEEGKKIWTMQHL